MSSTKTSRVGALIGAILLVASVALNVQLWRRSTYARPERNEDSIPLASTRHAEKTAPVTAGLTSLDFAHDADLATLRDALFAAGASDTRARQIIFGLLRRRWREAQTNKRLARIEHGWWKDESRTLGISRTSRWIGDDNILLKELVVDPMEALMGVDPAQAALVNARYSYLPEEARLKLTRLERERLLPGEWTPTGDPEADAKAEADMARLQKDNGEQIQKLLSGLTPEQRREYDMRFGPLGTRLANEYRGVAGSTEEEFRKLYVIAEEAAGSIPIGAGENAATLQAAADAAQRGTDRIIAELGYERGVEYLLSGSAEYRSVAAVAQQIGLPPTVPGRFAQLAAETGIKAAAIHKDESLNVEQRRAALLALQQNTRTEVDGLLPVDARRRLPPSSLAWLDQMSTGTYRLISPGIPGRSSTSIMTVNINTTAPNLPPTALRLMPVRPPGK